MCESTGFAGDSHPNNPLKGGFAPLSVAMWNDVLALNRLTAMLVLIVLAVAAYAAARRLAAMPVFAIRALEVRGAGGAALEHLSAERIGKECVPRIRGTLFTTDLADAKHAFESLPWVRTASVRRQWPGRLVVEIEEHQVLGRWNDEGGNRFVSRKGEAFNAPGESALGARLPLLTGPEGSERDVVRTYGQFRERLGTIGKAPQMVALSPRQAWTVRLSDGVMLDVGREQPSSTVISRVERFVAHYASTVAQFERIRRQGAGHAHHKCRGGQAGGEAGGRKAPTDAPRRGAGAARVNHVQGKD